MLNNPNRRVLLAEMFPSVFPVKVIILNKSSDEICIIRLNSILNEMNISHEKWQSKNSKTGKYKVFSTNLVIEHLDQLHELYSDFGTVEDVVKVL